jgi:hypothetical protein
MMTKEEQLFHDIATRLPDTKEGKMFGALCIKAANGKALAILWKNDMIFKLDRVALQEALSLAGAKLFEPMDNRPMREWVQLSFDYSGRWLELAKKAQEYVANIKT